MSSVVSQLIEVINRETKCLEKFLTLFAEEQKYLVENDVDSLRRCVEDQERTMRDAGQLEDKRIRLTDSLAEHLKIDKGKVNLSKLTDLVEESYSSRLRELQSTLSSLYARLERQRKKNEFLIKQSMKYVDRSIKIFSGMSGTDVNYTASKEKDKQVHLKKRETLDGLRFSTARQ